VIEIGDKIVFLFEGKKEWEGTSQDILENQRQELNDFIFASKLGERRLQKQQPDGDGRASSVSVLVSGCSPAVLPSE
jgi:ABC-type transporter Mla maintaining outer membrane lipid asymmetry ATPase subunit MlaF